MVKQQRAYDELEKALGILSLYINPIVETLAPTQFEAYSALRDKLKDKPWFRKIQSVDPGLHQCRSIAYNRAVTMHKDTRGPIGDLTIMVCVWARSGELSFILTCACFISNTLYCS